MRGGLRIQGSVGLLLAGLLTCVEHRAEAGWPAGTRPRPVVVTSGLVPTAAPVAPLGTFYPTPVMTVRGSFPTGGGYSPGDSFGDTSLDVYGPLSALRATAAPVMTYTRGYDGTAILQEGTGFSTPNLPGISPVVYPTQATPVGGIRNPITRTPPWWPKATTWIDQN